MQTWLSVATVVLFLAGGHCGLALSASERNLVVSLHNNYRSQLAQGNSGLPGGSRAPQGGNILKMSYDTSIENSAQTYANRCQFQHSGASGLGENLYMTTNNAQAVSTALSAASNLWWDELKKYGGVSSSDTTFTMNKINVGHWSQMAWAKTSNVGCGVAHCSSMTIVVCQYRVQGNYLNQNIYDVGSPCSKCSKGCAGNGLCSA